MPSQNPSPEHHQNDEPPSHSHPKLRRSTDDIQQQQTVVAAVAKEEEEDDVVVTNNDIITQQSSKEEDDVVLQQDLEEEEDPSSEFVYVDLHATRKEVQCPICLGIIKKTRTVMECLHRFCRECIDKSMRMGNNECPACRTHCASRRSLRDDPRFDELIAALYPDIRKFEEEELAFYEEDEARNKQVLIKQSEALGKKRSSNKDAAGPSVTKSQRKNQNSQTRKRGRRRNSSIEYQDSDNNDDVNDSDKQFSANEHHREVKPRRVRSGGSIEVSHSPSATNLSGGSFDNNVEHKEERNSSPALTIGKERLSWGKGGTRSNNRHGNANDRLSKRRLRVSNLVEFLHNLEENDDEPALQTPMKDENAQHLSGQDPNGSLAHQSTLQPSYCSNDKQTQHTGLLQDSLHRLDREKTLPGVIASCISNGEQLASMQILAYSQEEAM